jgi:GTP-binding protein EngB required for normal cell division
MTESRLPLRLVFLGALAIGVILVIGLAISALNSMLELYERLAALPLVVRLPLIIALAAAVLGLGWLAWKLLRPRRSPVIQRRGVMAPSREVIETRVADLTPLDPGAASLEQELLELDRRKASGECYVAVFGEISTGKSSLIRALAVDAAPDINVLGGTTRLIHHFRGQLPDGRELILADVPGSGEVDGAHREQLARDESLRAHAVIYVAASDMTRAQDAELRWLADFGKPLILALNKVDQLDDTQRQALLDTFATRYAKVVSRIVAVSAGGSEKFVRQLADGRIEHVERERTPRVEPVISALMQLTAGGSVELEPAREASVLASVELRASEIARAVAARESEATVTRYTRRAVIGAMAAVAPGSDIIIQGALATGMVRELARIHDVPVRELDVEGLLAKLGLTVRNTTAIVLAIAGNALKAFPGLGTLGGGALHAIAYGLVFDSVGRAIALTLADHAKLDQIVVERHVRELLAKPARDRLERVARMVLEGSPADESTRPD